MPVAMCVVSLNDRLEARLAKNPRVIRYGSYLLGWVCGQFRKATGLFVDLLRGQG